MSSIAIGLIALGWVLVSIGFALVVCPRLFRHMEGDQ